MFFKRASMLPRDGHAIEYLAAFDAAYPQQSHRSQYTDEAIYKVGPCFALRVVAALFSSQLTDCVFTTNFAQLVEEAVSPRIKGQM